MHLNTRSHSAADDQERAVISRIQSRAAGWQRDADALFQHHRPALLRRCHTQLRDLDDAEDATQETLLRAFRALGNFKGEASFRTWLFTIADNRCRTLATQRGRYVGVVDIEALIDTDDTHPNAEPVVAIDNEHLAGEALRTLSPKNRAVVELRFYRDLSIDEIAGTLAIGASAVKMRLQRALALCAQKLGPEQAKLAA